MIDTRKSEPVSQKPYPTVMKHYKWVKDEINKLLTAKVMRKPIQLVSTHHSSTKRWWRKTSSHWLSCTQQDHMKIYLVYVKGRRHFFTTEWCKILFNPKQPLLHHSENMDTSKYPLDSYNTCIFSGTCDRCLEGVSFHHCLVGWYHHLQQDSRGTPIPHQTSFQKITECTLINET